MTRSVSGSRSYKDCLRVVKMFIPLVLLPILVSGRCYGPEPEFPLPILSADSPQLSKVLNSIDRSLHNLVSKNAADYNATSFSVEITSSQSSLWSYHHTASVRNSSRPGAPKIDDDSVYRIASISKVFTTLGVLYQEKAGNLSLDAPVKTYIAELADPQNGTLPWHDITLRSLASQLSGIPRECESWSSAGKCSCRVDLMSLESSLSIGPCQRVGRSVHCRPAPSPRLSRHDLRRGRRLPALLRPQR